MTGREKRLHSLLYSCDSRDEMCERIVDLEDDNSRLRALLLDAYVEFVSVYGDADDAAEYAGRMHGLGIEVRG